MTKTAITALVTTAVLATSTVWANDNVRINNNTSASGNENALRMEVKKPVNATDTDSRNNKKKTAVKKNPVLTQLKIHGI